MLVVGLGGGCRDEGARSSEQPQPKLSTGQEAPFDVDAIMRQVHFSYRQEEDGWRGGHTHYDVKAKPEGLVLTPVRYTESSEPRVHVPHARMREELEVLDPPLQAERGAPLELGAARITRGSVNLSTSRPQGQVRADGHLAWVHGALVEHLRNGEQGVEQSWSFEAEPRGQGELRVRIPVRGLVHTGTSDRGLHFADSRTGLGFSYGHGTWVDARGQRTAVPAEFSEGAIHLRVPEQVLTASAWPAVLDPVITPEMIIDGRNVAADVNPRSHPAVAYNGTDYLVAWRNVRGGIHEVYAARVSSTGTVLDAGGIRLSAGLGGSYSPHIASNGTDFFVAWMDYRDDSYRIYGSRVTAGGQVTTPGGVPLRVTTNFDWNPKVASNGTDFLVVWEGLGPWGDLDVYARRVSSLGQPLDTGDILIATQLDIDEQSPKVASNGTHYLVVWSDWRDDQNSRAYGARVSNAGVLLDSGGFLLSSTASDQAVPAVASNGTDFLVAWLDWRNSPTDRDLYGTRVASNGTVVDGGGFLIAANPTHAETAPVVAANGSDFFVGWTEWDTTNQTRRILGSRVQGSLSVTSPVVDTTSLAYTSSTGNCQAPSVSQGASGYLMVWHCTSGSVTDLQSAQTSLTGTITAGGSFPVTTSSVHQTEPAVASNGSTYLVVWSETGGGGQSIYGVRLTPTGGQVDNGGFVISSTNRERQSPAVASNGTDYLVVWQDYRDMNWNIHGARVQGSGATSSAVVDSGSIVISSHSDFQNQPTVASDGTDYLVVWRQSPSNRADVYGARVTSGGVVQDTSGIAISTNLVDHYTPRVASNGDGYLVVWSESTSSTAPDIFGARVTSGGVVQDTSGIAIASYLYAQFEPAVASNGSDYFVVWTDHRGEHNHDIYGARVTSGGVVQDTSGVGVCTQTANQFSPAVTFDGTSYVVGWADFRYGSLWSVFTAQVAPASAAVTASTNPLGYDVRAYEPQVSLASAGNQQVLGVYSRYDTEPSTGSRRIRGAFITH